MLPEAIEVMTEELAQLGNPSSLHNAGRRARRVVEESREQIAEVLNARPSEVVFTSGGTEADNLAVKGLYWARREADPARRRVLVTSVEHHAVLDSVAWLSRHEGAEACWLDVDALGMLRPGALRAAIELDPGQVALVSVMWVNNEVGSMLSRSPSWPRSRTPAGSSSTVTPCRPRPSSPSTSPTAAPMR